MLPLSGIRPMSCNQLEAHPWILNTLLLEFMQQEAIRKAVFRSFAGKKSVSIPLLVDRLAEPKKLEVG